MCLSIKNRLSLVQGNRPAPFPYTKTAPVKQNANTRPRKRRVRKSGQKPGGEKPCKACLDAKAEEKKKEREKKRERFKKDLAEKRKVWDEVDKGKGKGC
jgi:hypothetical protein